MQDNNKPPFSDDELNENIDLIISQDNISDDLADEYRAHVKDGLSRNKLHAEAIWHLGCANLMNHRYSWWGFEYRSGWAVQLATQSWLYDQWGGQDCKLLILAEQGIGDEILFASCYNDVIRHCPDVTIECDPRLIPIFERSFGVKCVSRYLDDRKSIQMTGKDWRGPYDAYIPAGDVPRIYRRSRADFPGHQYLVPHPEYLAKWKREFQDHYTIGLSWYGGDGKHVLNPELFMEVDGYPFAFTADYDHVKGVRYIDLQYVGETEGAEKFDFENFDDEIACIAALHEVRTVPTALYHICGALGQHCTVYRTPPVYGNFNNRMLWQLGRPNDISHDWYNSVTISTEYENNERIS